MKIVPIEEASEHLSELIRQLPPGEQLVITENGRPTATLTGCARRVSRRLPGSARGKINIRAEDDEHLEGFE